MSKVLVTGGAGFIGSHFVRKLLEAGYEIIVLDSLVRGNKIEKELLSDIKLVKEDIRNTQVVFDLVKGCEKIFHLAALLGVDIVADKPIETMDVEVTGMKNIVDAAIYHKVSKVIYTSTSGVYGKTAIEKSVTEEFTLDPKSSYSIAKRYNEIYLRAAFEEKGIESISLRYFNVYGIRQDNRMVIPRFFEQALNNKAITVYGSGNQTRDFTYVDDVVRSSIDLSEKVRGCEIFNIAHEEETSIYKLAELIKEITNSKSEINRLESPAKRYDFEVERRTGSCEKLLKHINYKPHTSLEEGLKMIFSGYAKNQ